MIFFFMSFLFLFLLLALSSCTNECRHRDMTKNVIPPSCGDRGYTVFVCNDCSFSFESDFVAPAPHTLMSTTVAPTCLEGGYTLNTCSTCDYSYISDPIPKKDHKITSVTIAPTCTTNGYTLRECLECGYTSNLNLVSPVPHEFTTTKVAPTCEKEGYTVYSCKNCKFEYVADEVSALFHSFTSEVTKPTCLLQGFTTKTCSLCKTVVKTDYTNPTGHIYDTTKVRTTSSSDGYTLYDCKNCEYSYKSDFEYTYSVFMGAYTDSNNVLARGIDVSSYNGILNWTTIANAGVDFAILRAGSSLSGKDANFDINYRDARNAGLDIGVYYYVEATSVEEILVAAEDLKKIINGKQFEYPIYLDIEKDELGAALGKGLLTNMCISFIEKLQSDGYFAALYTNNNWLENFYNKDLVLRRYDVWYARYLPLEDICDPEWSLEKYGATMGMWQYTNMGVIDGIDGVFDLNLSYRDYPTIIKRYHYNGY